MAGGVMTAAWIQAVPVWTASLIAVVGLTGWRRQRRGERLLKHAEKALGAGRETVMLVRAIRSRMYSMPKEEADDLQRRRKFKLEMTFQAVERARISCVRFNKYYSAAWMFKSVTENAIYPPSEVYECMTELWTAYMNIHDLEEFGDNERFRDELVKARDRFFGRSRADQRDEIGDQLSNAEREMEKELKLILLPVGPLDAAKSHLMRVTAWCRSKLRIPWSTR